MIGGAGVFEVDAEEVLIADGEFLGRAEGLEAGLSDGVGHVLDVIGGEHGAGGIEGSHKDGGEGRSGGIGGRGRDSSVEKDIGLTMGGAHGQERRGRGESLADFFGIESGPAARDGIREAEEFVVEDVARERFFDGRGSAEGWSGGLGWSGSDRG